jgi:hypothetical protein
VLGADFRKLAADLLLADNERFSQIQKTGSQRF